MDVVKREVKISDKSKKVKLTKAQWKVLNEEKLQKFILGTVLGYRLGSVGSLDLARFILKQVPFVVGSLWGIGAYTAQDCLKACANRQYSNARSKFNELYKILNNVTVVTGF